MCPSWFLRVSPWHTFHKLVRLQFLRKIPQLVAKVYKTYWNDGFWTLEAPLMGPIPWGTQHRKEVGSAATVKRSNSLGQLRQCRLTFACGDIWLVACVSRHLVLWTLVDPSSWHLPGIQKRGKRWASSRAGVCPSHHCIYYTHIYTCSLPSSVISGDHGSSSLLQGPCQLILWLLGM